MRSIERKFKLVEKHNSSWSSFICFANTVRGQRFSERKIRMYFNTLVDKEDYAMDEKGEILEYLYELTNDAL